MKNKHVLFEHLNEPPLHVLVEVELLTNIIIAHEILQELLKPVS
jgi:hypothetical protein